MSAWGPRGALQRTDFSADKAVTARDFTVEAEYRAQLYRNHLRYAHGWGVVCGLVVVAAPALKQPWRVRICPGFAVSPCGDELALPHAMFYDLRDALAKSPQGAIARSAVVLAVRYMGEDRSRVAVPTDCRCGNVVYRASRRRDGVEVAALWNVVQQVREEFDVCKGETPVCVPCPDTCDVPLAAIRLPASTKVSIEDADIDNGSWRRYAN